MHPIGKGICSIYQVSSFSASLLEGVPPHGLRGEVIATFHRSCYVLGETGNVLCIGDQSLEDGPLTIRVEFPDPCDIEALGIKTGTSLRWHDENIWLDEEILLRTSGARKWVPPAVALSGSSEEILRRLRTLKERLGTDAPHAGLASLVQHSEDLAHARAVHPQRSDERVAHFALPAVLDLVKGVWSRDGRKIDTAVQNLVGLGPGLTPSGDDFLGGMMVGLITTINTKNSSVLGREAQLDVWADLQNLIASLAGAISRHAASGTTTISAALLSHAAAGVGTDTVHRLLQALLAPDSNTSSVGAALAVTSSGHTSGWDCLAGILLGIHLGLRLRNHRRASSTAAVPIGTQIGTM